ncbi:MAG: hypothetical protein LBJ94_00565 [Puniceicoccales bacterium]|nr:hypothetical protein [Puniceicoccales bacterium]
METKWQLVAISCRLQKPPLCCLPTSSRPRSGNRREAAAKHGSEEFSMGGEIKMLKYSLRSIHRWG